MSPIEFISSGVYGHDTWILKGVYIMGIRKDSGFLWVSIGVVLIKKLVASEQL